MKRFTTLLTAVVFGGLVMQTGLVLAKGDGNNGGNGNRKKGNTSSNQSQSGQQSVKVAKVNKALKNQGQNGTYTIGDKKVSDKMWRPAGSGAGQGALKPNLVQKNLEGWKQIGDSFKISKHDKKKDQAVLGPGRPDGRVEVPQSGTPQGSSEATLLISTAGSPQLQTKPGVTTIVPNSGSQGYVWNNGHWERPKANGTSVSTSGAPVNSVVQMTDHRPVKGRGENVTPPPVDKNGNTTKVTVSVPKELTGQTVYGSGYGIGTIIHVHNPKTIIDALPPWGFSVAPDPRDHRTPNDPRKDKK
ncbi:MAG: hypothetical protein K8T91_06500 [Planctomycetes bacterium]|nr:hypothetical protein [Planctomycetota bacterium]